MSFLWFWRLHLPAMRVAVPQWIERPRQAWPSLWQAWHGTTDYWTGSTWSSERSSVSERIPVGTKSQFWKRSFRKACIAKS